MPVMATTMEFSRYDRFKGALDVFVHWKSVHVRAQTYRAISFALPFQDADHACSTDATMDFDPTRSKKISDYLPSTVFLKADLGVCMKVMSDSDDVR